MRDSAERRGFLRNALSNIIIAAGIGWVIFIFWREIPNLQDDFHVASWTWLGYTVAAGIAAQLLLVPVFRMILCRIGGLQISYCYAARLLFVAQILRHLPGRLWGIVYLVKETRQTIPTAAMIRANLDVMFYSIVFSLLVAAMLVLGVLVAIYAAVIFVTLSLLLILVSIRYDWTGGVLRKAVRLAPSRAAQYDEALRLRESVSWRAALSIVGCFVFAWGLYVSIWWAIPRIFAGLSDVNIWMLCATYSAAWVIGYVVMITPGGLGVREAGFVAMSTKLATLPALTFLVVFVRLWQILIESLLFLAFAFVKRGTDANELTGAKKFQNR